MDVMHNHSETSEHAPRPTPQEIVDAIQAVEETNYGRQHSGDQIVEQTIEELGIPVRPEDVLAEISTRRQVSGRRTSQRSRIPRVMVAAAVVIIALALFFLVNRQTHRGSEVPASIPQASDNQARYDHLQNVTSNRDFFCNADTFNSILDSGPGADPIVQVSGDHRDFWSLVRKNGRVYARAWMSEDDALKFQSGNYTTEAYRLDENFGDRVHMPVEIPVARIIVASESRLSILVTCEMK